MRIRRTETSRNVWRGSRSTRFICLWTDTEAEHLPGCNVAFEKAALEAVGGFDPQFWTAGDDVDMCWQLLEQGRTLDSAPVRRFGTAVEIRWLDT